MTLSLLLAASEAAPLAQTGGLADVIGSLPEALVKQGLQVAVVLPAYQQILASGRSWDTFLPELPITLAGETLAAKVLVGRLTPEVPVYLIQYDPFFDRPGLYGPPGADYNDNPERFIFFSKAAAALVDHLPSRPHLVAANDWQTGLIMPLLERRGPQAPKGVFIVHNQGYLGLASMDKAPLTGLPPAYFSFEGLEYYGQISFLKAGLVYSQAIVTVSPTYALEVQTPEGGQGLDGVMRKYSAKLHGILNGLDYREWNPQTDDSLPANYGPEDLAGKLVCKKALLAEMGLTGRFVGRPLLGMVTRLTPQKGLSLLLESIEDIFKRDAALVILGSGEPTLEDALKGVKTCFPEQLGLRLGYDRALSHRIIAGCDFFLMPSLYEPCGLAQMYALKYGSPPIVRAVGGLNDTVRDEAGRNQPGLNDTGFKFHQFQSGALLRAIRRAAEAYEQPDVLLKLRLAGMAEDFSWDRSAKEYAGLFQKLAAGG